MDHSGHAHHNHHNRHHHHQGHLPPGSRHGDLSSHDPPDHVTTPLSHTLLQHVTESIQMMHNSHNHYHGDDPDPHRHHHGNDLGMTTPHSGHHHGHDLDPHRHHDMHDGHMQHGGHSTDSMGSMGSMGHMHMAGHVEPVFEWVKEVNVLVEQWTTSTAVEVALAMLAAAALAAIYDMIRYYLSNWDSAHAVMPKMSRGRLLLLRIYRSSLHALTAGIGYIQMLFAMTYDLRIFVAIILGSGVGFFILGPIFRRLQATKKQKLLKQMAAKYRRCGGRRSTGEETERFVEVTGATQNNMDDRGAEEQTESRPLVVVQTPSGAGPCPGQLRSASARGCGSERNAERGEEEENQEGGDAETERVPIDTRLSIIVLDQSALDELETMRDTVV